MLVVISDLHFEEEASDAVGALDGTKRVAFRRNLPASAFEQVVAQLAEEAVRNSAKRLDLVLAGDIFDLHRTQLWFEQEGAQLRPYVSCENVASSRSLEDKIFRVLDAIAAEEDVKESLAVFQRLTKQKFVQKTGNSKREESFPVPVSLHYMPGNHDRLANATNRIRARVRELLGLPADDKPFLHAVMLEDPRVLVRHGHEYDRFNFSVNYSGMGLPSSIPEHEYSSPCFGDFVTVQVASRLPNLFRKHHSAQAIATDATLEVVYVRLLEFDDLRPQSALLDFLLHIPGSDLSEDAIWTRLKPVAVQLLDEVSREEFLWHWLRQLRISWVIRLAFWSRVWRLGLPLWLVRLVATRMSGGDQGPARFAAQEEVIRRGEVRLVIAGHTHHPEVAHLRTTGALKQYYVDTGTWRNRVLMTPTRDSFGRVKALTYVVVYASDEDPAHRDPAAPKQESFDYWSGFTQRWPLADTDA
jgi:UDP-2,3-diacylglucosamine pyrophosphatase LpxH